VYNGNENLSGDRAPCNDSDPGSWVDAGTNAAKEHEAAQEIANHYHAATRVNSLTKLVPVEEEEEELAKLPAFAMKPEDAGLFRIRVKVRPC
jgi:hypothetical protein